MIKTPEQKLSRNPSNAGYTNPLKSYDVPAKDNPDGTINVHAQPVYGIDPNQEPIPLALATLPYSQSLIGAAITPNAAVIANPASNAGNWQPQVAQNMPIVAAVSSLYSPSLNVWQATRTPTTFVHALCTTVAATVVWDPAAGKKFRLMGYVIVPAAGMAAAGIQLITLLDEAAAITIAHQVYLPIAASVTNQPPIVVELPGNGYLSVAADNRLSVTLTSACTAGAISVMAYGTEE